MLRKLDQEYDKQGLTINTDKTEYIVLGVEGVMKEVNSCKLLSSKFIVMDLSKQI